MPTPSVIPVAVLEPVSAEKPAGEDLSGSSEWVKIRKARPDTIDVVDKGDFARVDGANAKWPLLAELVTSALTTRSKDLRLAIWAAESAIHQHGFAGVRDGIRTVRELISRYWDLGLFPLIEDGDLEARSGPLEWLNEKMADAIRCIPLTRRPPPGVNYSYHYYIESGRSPGIITAEEWDRAVASTKRAEYELLYEDFQQAESELKDFEQLARDKFGERAPTTSEAKEAFEECRLLLERILNAKRASEPDASTSSTPDLGEAAASHGHELFSLKGSSDENGHGSWAVAEQLARNGNVDQALAQMGRLAASEANGRVRFQRKLLLAEICLKRGRNGLAKSILEELAEQIDKHQLENWETAEVVGAVWSRLHRCYRTSDAGDPEKARKLFERLCRLDPWQALGCSEEK
jgi:type VI secretion system protein ImpA